MGKSIQMKSINEEKFYPHPYYPVGSIYLSVNNTNPTKWFGGIWEQIEDTFLLACGSTYNNGETGGSATHKHTEGDLRAEIGSANGQADTINFRAVSPENPNTGESENGTYTIKSTTSATGEAFSHYTPVVGYTSTVSNIPPYLAIYVWKRIA